MGEFKGTKEEFNQFFGPLIRNKIQYSTKKRKKELGYKCQKCKDGKELEAAHKKSKSRLDFVYEILEKNNPNNNSIIFIKDIKICIDEIITKHKPIDKIFLFLCRDCHNKYDKKKK